MSRLVLPRRSVVRAAAEDPLLSRVAARLEPAMRRAFVAAVQGVAGIIDVGDLADAVASGSVSQVEAAARLAELETAYRRALLPVVGRSFAVGVSAGATMPALAEAVTAFDLINPQAITWVQAHGAELVVQITDSTRAGLRALLSAGTVEGVSPYNLAQEIREVVGLYDRQIAAVEAYRARLVEADTPPSTIKTRVAKYADAQLDYRAEMIARTETMTAANAGQDALWQEAKDEGLLNPDDTRRVWIAVRDDRLDTKICLQLDDEETTLDDPWELDGEEYQRPPGHPGCRCTAGLVFK